jgi:formylglycine-generating enzyme required for sulfatase activity
MASEARAVAPKETSVDLGGGVKMEFVWIEALKCWVGKYEVTNAEYRRFKKDHSSRSTYYGKNDSANGDRQPVIYVSHEDAVAFAEWINKTKQLPHAFRARLPDGKEWLTFAQCGDGRKYPWGNEMPPKYGIYENLWGGPGDDQYYGRPAPVTFPVEKSGQNDWGLFGVGGNVCEWTSELDEYSQWVARGASFFRDYPSQLECSYRYGTGHEPGEVDPEVGFRLLLSQGDVETKGKGDVLKAPIKPVEDRE